MDWLPRRWSLSAPLRARLLHPITLSLIAANTVAMMYAVPLVLKEAVANSTTRVAFEAALARELKSFPAGVPILMYNSDHIGALQQAGLPLPQTLSDGDYDSWVALSALSANDGKRHPASGRTCCYASAAPFSRCSPLSWPGRITGTRAASPPISSRESASSARA